MPVQSGNIWQWNDFLRHEALRDAQAAAAPVREGRAFAHVAGHIPIRLSQPHTFAGEFDLSARDDEPWARFDRWLSERDTGQAPPAQPRLDIWDQLNEHFHCLPSNGGSAHTTVDYARVVTSGVTGILADIKREADGADQEKREYLDGMRAALAGLVTFAERFAALAEQQNLRELAARCRHVPRHPARSCHEALQAIWFVHLGVALSECSGASLSLGRLDQYLFPLFEQDRADGATVEELGEALADFFRLLNGFGDPACTINLGPATVLNPLSQLIVKTVKRLKLPSPILAARIQPDTPAEMFDLLTDPALVEIGQPTFYGEEPCREALRRRGVPECELPNWAANSCMGLMMPGQEWSNMWGSVVNVLLPLELALNGGRPFQYDAPMPFSTSPPDSYTSFDSLCDTVRTYLDELIAALITETAERTERRGRALPNPFVSALLDDCVARGQDRLLGGCRYHTVIVEAFGLVNAADALAAIRQLVFEENRYTLDEMVAAARGDFTSQPEVLLAVRQAPKYGNGDTAADGIARDLAERFAESVSRHSTDAVAYCPSFHTLDAHIPAGAKIGASLDGRRAGDPLAKNVGTAPGRATEGHTALIRSAATIDQSAFFGGQALDLWIDPRTIRTQDGKRKLQALLQTYFKLGGLQIQVNGVSPDILRAAMAAPDSHGHVLVRKAGYTTRYVTLPCATQAELLQRFEAGL